MKKASTGVIKSFNRRANGARGDVESCDRRHDSASAGCAKTTTARCRNDRGRRHASRWRRFLLRGRVTSSCWTGGDEDSERIQERGAAEGGVPGEGWRSAAEMTSRRQGAAPAQHMKRTKEMGSQRADRTVEAHWIGRLGRPAQ